MIVMAALIAASSVVAAKPPAKKVIVADNPEQFELLVTAIQQEMAPGKRYEFLNSHNRSVVNHSLGEMGSMLNAAGSVDAMTPEEKTRLFSIQEEVNGILARNADDRLVCTRQRPTGSQIPVTTCHTVRELARSRDASRQIFKQLGDAQNAYDQSIRTSEN
ncbi:MAG TPA: hypothetical protein VFN25_05100 [Dokdonella sp.]|uniref:hypothetical protein n=1 Tax=Dokdonella sp. TaxID=2291710 RepID=UPI002D7F148D|nr:hypothetical protein [Dokdonella sp.]HET9032266.1 hypothetical protein [Dokdonella sp.]